MTSLVQHAKRELRAAGLFDADADYNGEVALTVTSIMEVFTAYGHSGESADQTIELFVRLAKGLPLTPLTGGEDEWEPSNVSKLLVNKRCHRVFMDDEMAWDVKVGRTPIAFPYTPK